MHYRSPRVVRHLHRLLGLAQLIIGLLIIAYPARGLMGRLMLNPLAVLLVFGVSESILMLIARPRETGMVVLLSPLLAYALALPYIGAPPITTFIYLLVVGLMIIIISLLDHIDDLQQALDDQQEVVTLERRRCRERTLSLASD